MTLRTYRLLFLALVALSIILVGVFIHWMLIIFYGFIILRVLLILPVPSWVKGANSPIYEISGSTWGFTIYRETVRSVFNVNTEYVDTVQNVTGDPYIDCKEVIERDIKRLKMCKTYIYKPDNL